MIDIVKIPIKDTNSIITSFVVPLIHIFHNDVIYDHNHICLFEGKPTDCNYSSSIDNPTNTTGRMSYSNKQLTV